MSVLGALGVGGSSVLDTLRGAGGGGGGSTSTSGTGIIPGMMDIYNQTLKLNQGIYGDVLGSYTGGRKDLAATLPEIYQGYGKLQGNVAGILGQGGDWGVATPAAQAISEAFKRTQGQTQQDLINRGLGNTSVLSSAANQNTLMAGRAYGNLGAELANKYAGYASQIGMAGLGTQMQGAQAQAQLAAQQGSTLAGRNYAMPGPLVGGFGQSQSYGGRGPTPLGGAGPIGPRAGGRLGGGFGGVDQGAGGPAFQSFTQGAPAQPGGYNPMIGRPPIFPGGDAYGPSQNPMGNIVSSVGDPFSGFNYGSSGGVQSPEEVDFSGIDLTGGGGGDAYA